MAALKSLLRLRISGEPWRARTSDPLIKSAFKGTPAGYGCYDLLTFVTGCSRQRVYLLRAINECFSVFWSQVGHKSTRLLARKLFVHQVAEHPKRGGSRDDFMVNGFEGILPDLTKRDEAIFTGLAAAKSRFNRLRLATKCRHLSVIPKASFKGELRS
jgi:hypothetical protein